MSKNQKQPTTDVLSYDIVGKNMCDIRKRQDLTQSDVAECMGISSVHYSNCERGVRKMTLDRLIMFCIMTHASMIQLLEGATGEFDIFAREQDQVGNETKMVTQIEQCMSECSDEIKEVMAEVCVIISRLNKRCGQG